MKLFRPRKSRGEFLSEGPRPLLLYPVAMVDPDDVERALELAVDDFKHVFNDEAHRIEIAVSRWAQHWLAHHDPTPVGLMLTVPKGDNDMTAATLILGAPGAWADLQFVDAHGNPTAGPQDSVTGAPIVPTLVSSDPTVLSVGATQTGATPSPGAWTVLLTPLAVGAAQVSVAPLLNSDGSPVVETRGPSSGAPFQLPSPVNITVDAGVAESLTLTIIP